jgi:hypothetical protein
MGGAAPRRPTVRLDSPSASAAASRVRNRYGVGDRVSDRGWFMRRRGTVRGWHKVGTHQRRYWVDWDNDTSGLYPQTDLRRA